MWHEARRSERRVHDMMDAARRRAERRAVYLAKRRGDPQQSLRLVGTRCRVHHDPALYQATQDQQGLIPWNGRNDNLIDRFDGRALLDFIRENDGRFRNRGEKTEEEEELEERVNFERYRDLIKHRRRGLNDEEGLDDVEQELEAKAVAPFVSDRQRAAQAVQPGMGTYAQVGFVYDGEGREDYTLSDSDGFDEDDDDDDSSSEDSEDEEIEVIARKYGVNRFNWLLYMDRKAKEEEKKQKEAVKGDPAMRKLSRKERRKASQQEREKEKEVGRITSTRFSHHDPYREPRGSPTYEDYSRFRRGRSRSRSHSPRSRRQDRQGSYERGREAESLSKKSSRTRVAPSKIEYITEFGSTVEEEPGFTVGISPPSSPPSQADSINRLSGGQILEALHNDPAASAGTPFEKERSIREARGGPVSASSAIAKLSKPVVVPALPASKAPQGEKKETPQERLKRIMSKQLNKQIKRDTVTELAKRREQERLRQEKLAETRRIAQHRRRSRSRSRSRSQSPYNRYYRSRSRSRSRSPPRSHHRSPSSRSHKSH